MTEICHVKLNQRPHMYLQLGFGVYGPGCQAPSRFLDYGMYHKWVERNVQRTGKPTITTISDNHVIFRRSKFQEIQHCAVKLDKPYTSTSGQNGI